MKCLIWTSKEKIIIIANADLINLNEFILGFSIDQVTNGGLVVVGITILILTILDIVTVKRHRKPSKDKRDWNKK